MPLCSLDHLGLGHFCVSQALTGSFAGMVSGAGSRSAESDGAEATDSEADWNQRARGESEAQRLDRNLDELLQELRVSQTGVQILFAFLLTIPFQARFADVTEFQRNLYIGTLVTTVLAGCLLIAPVSFHRLVFRRKLKAQLVRGSHYMAQGGLLLMAVALTASTLLVLDVVLGGTGARLLAALCALWFVLFWYVWPITVRIRHHSGELEDIGTESGP